MSQEAELPQRLHGALETLREHSVTHPRTLESLDALTAWTHRQLRQRSPLRLSAAGGRLLLDGELLPRTEDIHTLLELFQRHGIGGIRFELGLTARELRTLLLLLTQDPARILQEGGAVQALRTRGCVHLCAFDACAAGLPMPESLPPLPGASPERLPPPPAPPEEGPLERRLRGQLAEGIGQLEAEAFQALVRECIEMGLRDLFFESLGQLRTALEGEEGPERAKAFAVLQGLALDPTLPPPPKGALPLLATTLSACLEREPERAPRLVPALSGLLGLMGARGEIDGVQTFLEAMERGAPPALLRHAFEIRSGDAAAAPLLEILFREGRGSLETRVLPFFRMLGEGGAEALARHLAKEDNRQRRSRILDLLRTLGAPSRPALRARLDGEPWFLVRNALNLLGELGDGEARPELEACLEHGDLRVRRAAVRALWKACGPEAAPRLLELLPRSDAETQGEIVTGLGQLQAIEAIPAIAALASHAPDALRIQALEALGAMGVADVLPVLAEHLKRKGIFRSSEPLAVRLACVRALARLGSPEARRLAEAAIAREPRPKDQAQLREALETLHPA